MHKEINKKLVATILPISLENILQTFGPMIIKSKSSFAVPVKVSNQSIDNEKKAY